VRRLREQLRHEGYTLEQLAAASEQSGIVEQRDTAVTRAEQAEAENERLRSELPHERAELRAIMASMEQHGREGDKQWAAWQARAEQAESECERLRIARDLARMESTKDSQRLTAAESERDELRAEVAAETEANRRGDTIIIEQTATIERLRARLEGVRDVVKERREAVAEMDKHSLETKMNSGHPITVGDVATEIDNFATYIDAALAEPTAERPQSKENVATAAVVYLAGKLSTPDKLSPAWVSEALEVGRKTISELDPTPDSGDSTEGDPDAG
jgi:chromosome segregation ATPase